MIEVNGKRIQWSPGITIENLLEEMDGVELCSAVRLNGKIVSSPNFAETEIQDNSKILLLPLVAGG